MTQLALFDTPTPKRAAPTPRRGIIVPSDTHPAWVIEYDKPGAPKQRVANILFPQFCQQCSTWILAGHDDYGIPALIDPVITADPRIEAAAIILGRRTFQLDGKTPHLFLFARVWPGAGPHLPCAPASNQLHAAFQHVHGRPPLPGQPIPTISAARLPDEPPF